MPLEAGKGRSRKLPPEPPEDRPASTPGFSPERPELDSTSNCKRIICVVHKVSVVICYSSHWKLRQRLHRTSEGNAREGNSQLTQPGHCGPGYTRAGDHLSSPLVGEACSFFWAPLDTVGTGRLIQSSMNYANTEAEHPGMEPGCKEPSEEGGTCHPQRGQRNQTGQSTGTLLRCWG